MLTGHTQTGPGALASAPQSSGASWAQMLSLRLASEARVRCRESRLQTVRAALTTPPTQPHCWLLHTSGFPVSALCQQQRIILCAEMLAEPSWKFSPLYILNNVVASQQCPEFCDLLF